MSSFQKDLEALINCHCQENVSNTPDFILADFLSKVLAAFDEAVNRREIWYNRRTRTGSIMDIDSDVAD
jgi:hypothetical protein